jgi:hypothetical protein
VADTRALVDRFRTDIYPHIAPWLAEATAELAGTPGDFAVLAGKAGASGTVSFLVGVAVALLIIAIAWRLVRR